MTHDKRFPFATVDWKAHPNEVLDEVNGLIATFGLVVFYRDSGGDDFQFAIGPRDTSRPDAITAFKTGLDCLGMH